MSHVLIVDDEPDIATVLAEILEDEGFDVRVAHDGRQGLEFMMQKRPDLLLTDLMMPRMDGHALIREMQNREALRDVPIVVMSAGMIDKSLITIDVRFVPKPFAIDQILSAVQEMLGKRGGTR